MILLVRSLLLQTTRVFSSSMASNSRVMDPFAADDNSVNGHIAAFVFLREDITARARARVEGKEVVRP